MKPITIRFWLEDDTPTPIDVDAAVAALAARVAAEQCHGAALLTDEEIVRTADNIGRLAYRATVDGFVEDLKQQIKDGEIGDQDGALEYLEQSIDGCHDVIYTYAAQEVCRHSENDGAYYDEFGSDAEVVEDGQIQWSKLAYFALLRDVYDDLGDLADLFREPEQDEDEDEDDESDEAQGDREHAEDAADARQADDEREAQREDESEKGGD